MNLTTIALLLALNAAPAEPPAAQERPACECGVGGHSRQLGGATFLFPILQQNAFVSSYVGLRQGASELGVPDLPVGILGTRDVSLIGYQTTLDLGLRLTPWLGLWGEGRGTLYSGLTVGSFLAEGGFYQAGGEGGLVLRLLRLDASGTQLSLRAGGGYVQGRELSLFPLLSAVVNAPGETLESILSGTLGQLLIVPTSESSVLGGLYLAQTLGTPILSLQASASARRLWRTFRPFDLTVGDRVDQDTTSTRFELGAALTADFKTLGVPLALLGEYRYTGGHQTEVELERTELHVNSVALGLFYSGRPNLQLGLEGVAILNDVPRIGTAVGGGPAKSDNSHLTYGQLDLRYIW